MTFIALASLVLAACGVGEKSGGIEPTDGWSIERAEADGVLLSVWGTGSRDLWAAGGQVDRGLVLHSDGHGWTPVETGAPSLVWWIYGFAADDVYAVGEHGLIVHFDGRSWTRVASGTDATLYGLWGASADDVWIVGGDPSGAPGSAVILRGHGSSFHAVEDVPPELVPEALYKVYGITGTVLVVGRNGTVLRYDGQAWRRDDVPTRRPIVSLWARGANDIYAVGGQDVGEFLHFDGQAWSAVPGLGLGPGLNGVFTAPGRPVFAVGTGASIVELSESGDAVRSSAPGLDPRSVLHSVWGDETGAVYAVGGALLDYPARMSGVILRKP